MATSPLSVIILAAGKGKRMYSALPKVLHQVGGVPLLEHVLRTASRLNAAQIFVVHGNGGDQVHEAMAHWPVTWIKQAQQLGTGHAVLQAMADIPAHHQILTLYGDTPLISLETLQQLLQSAPPNGIGLLTAQFADPTGYGRIIRDAQQHIIAIIEQRDASPEEQRIHEINTGILTTAAKHLQEWLPKLKPHNQQAEYYLTDIIKMAVAAGCPITSVTAQHAEEVRGINDQIQLATVERYYQAQQTKKMMLQGVTLLDPQRFDLRGELHAEQDVVIDVNVIIEGHVFLGANCRVGANTVLRNVRAGANVVFKENCVIEDAEISEGCVIGPFARIRPGTHLAPNVHIGNFVELKKSTLGENSKAGHLAYLGDATIGKNVNVGAGTITCNYDGVNKNPTIIQDGAFIGSDVMLVAPVTVGENATIGAGSTISRDVPANRLTVARAQQKTIENWSRPKKKISDCIFSMNYMRETTANLKKLIEKATSNNRWEITHFAYDAKNCSDIDDAGPGVWCNLKGYGNTWRLFYPAKNYPTLESFIDSLNCDLAMFNAFMKYPDLGIYGNSLINNELTIIHAETKEQRMLALNAIYNRETGIIDAAKLQQMAQEVWQNLATARGYAYRGIPSVSSVANIPEKIIPPFFLKPEDL